MAHIDDIKNALLDYDPEAVVSLVEAAAAAGAPPLEIVDLGLIPAIKIVGDKFREFEIFLPEVMMAAKAFKAGFDVLAPKLTAAGYEPRGRVVVGSVEGDIHDIGKNIVIALLQGSGYEVHDAGVDVPPSKFVEMVRDLRADVVGMSALLTTTMMKMKDTVDELGRAGLRGGVKVIIGGAPASEAYAAEIGADGYGADASEAAALVQSLIGK